MVLTILKNTYYRYVTKLIKLVTSSFLSSIFPQFLVRKTWHLVRDLEFRKWQSSKIFYKWEGSFFMSFFNNYHVFHFPTVIDTNLALFQKFMLEILILTTTFLVCILNNYFLNFHQININPSLYFVSLCFSVDLWYLNSLQNFEGSFFC